MARTIAVLSPRSAEFPSTSFPQLKDIHSTAKRPVLAYATGEEAYWTLPVPQGFTGTMTCVLSYCMDSATANDIKFEARGAASAEGAAP